MTVRDMEMVRVPCKVARCECKRFQARARTDIWKRGRSVGLGLFDPAYCRCGHRQLMHLKKVRRMVTK